MSTPLHPAAPHSLPFFLPAPDGADALLVGTGLFLIGAVVTFGLVFLRIHTLPERMAHRGHKMQFEIVAVLGLLALFTHIHAFWVAGLLLALVDIPDFSGPMRRIAGSTERIAGLLPGAGDTVENGTPTGMMEAQQAPRVAQQDIAPEGQRARSVAIERHEA